MYPKLISIGSFSIPTYGVLVALGFLAGLWIATKLARRIGLPSEKVTNLAVYCAMGGILGAKLFMFLFDFGYYWNNPGQIFSLETLQAAGVFHGGFLVAFIVAALYIRHEKLPLAATMDAFAPGIALGHSIGRVGCFAAGCCWGKPCHLPWAVVFHSDAAAPVPLNIPLHPAQLYESAANLLIFGILYRLFNRQHRAGEVIGFYLVLYSTARFIIEFYREHEQPLVGPFSLTQWLALGFLALGAVILIKVRTGHSASEPNLTVAATVRH
ncbi:MAG TPA: prolipoprotein diacylglyceryl transferase [Bryobacteraceae bacterium]|jgi:phosphatidylglycerol:prolipoprotein diacylglycerol transferase|nr:prolipoprotein diacylglyceryl transferase [Bryobacteraceae bacterium]